ncbi:GL24083 [Drosophila persimilis]|uniref:GL24083 n=1 Tax=Drosophila persimilis TaxID=7234 RepID=B4G3C5_DROPE|nr:GL24083 [Drosophila persimilis]
MRRAPLFTPLERDFNDDEDYGDDDAVEDQWIERLPKPQPKTKTKSKVAAGIGVLVYHFRCYCC